MIKAKRGFRSRNSNSTFASSSVGLSRKIRFVKLSDSQENYLIFIISEKKENPMIRYELDGVTTSQFLARHGGIKNILNLCNGNLFV